jgi:hypothetical protein
MRHPRALMAITISSALIAAAIITSCSNNPTSSPKSLTTANMSGAQTSTQPTIAGGPPGYEPAYVNDTTVLINAIEVRQNPTQHAQADFYEVVYPFDPVTGQELPDFWPSPPQCDPCDHQGNGITPDDFHDHVLDSRPSDPGHGNYSALWHVYLIMPNYTSSADHNAAVNAMLRSLLPAMSEDAVNALLSTPVEGVPLAIKIDTNFYFLCAVVNGHAGGH